MNILTMKTEKELFFLYCSVTKYEKLNSIKQVFILLVVFWLRNLERVQVDSVSLIQSFFIHTRLGPGLGWLEQLIAGHIWFRQLSFHVASMYD